MKNQKQLIQFLVISALLGFLACSGYLFYQSFEMLVDGRLPPDYLEQLNSALIYITSGLTGLVGGIVATGFGVKQTVNTNDDVPSKPYSYKFQNLGSLVVPEKKSDESKEKIGFYYALAYIIVGIVAIIIWVILGENAIQSVSNMATTFFGMLIPIVAQFFNNQN